jgi:F0F1-type ATP synthase delta subunit
MKLTGRTGELVEQLFISGSKTNSFDKFVKEINALVAAYSGAGLVVSRFFSTHNYSAKECKVVFSLLTTTNEPLTSFDSIKDTEIKELFIDNAGNLDAWRNARKEIADAKLSKEVLDLFETLANEGKLFMLPVAKQQAAELLAVSSKSLDVEVKSATSLNKDIQGAIAKALPGYCPPGQTLNIKYTVDAAVLGGLLITIGGKQTIDLSASTKLVEVVSQKH